MAKSAIYIVQPGILELTDGDTIPLGTTIRRYGQNVRQDGNSVTLCSKNGCGGYYKVDIVASVEAAAAAPVVVSLQKDGIDVFGARAEITLPAATVAPFPISAIVRTVCDSANLSVVVTGADVKVVNMTTVVEKL